MRERQGLIPCSCCGAVLNPASLLSQRLLSSSNLSRADLCLVVFLSSPEKNSFPPTIPSIAAFRCFSSRADSFIPSVLPQYRHLFRASGVVPGAFPDPASSAVLCAFSLSPQDFPTNNRLLPFLSAALTPELRSGPPLSSPSRLASSCRKQDSRACTMHCT